MYGIFTRNFSCLYGVLCIDNSGSSISMGKKVYPFPSRLSNKAVMLEQRPIRLLKNTVVGTLFFSLFRKCLCKLHYIYICPTVYLFNSKFWQDRFNFMVLGLVGSVWLCGILKLISPHLKKELIASLNICSQDFLLL